MGQVHPRSRGEIAPADEATVATTGSPPLARGNHVQGPTVKTEARFTPARAGKSLGEPLGQDLLGGSPPLARGNP